MTRSTAGPMLKKILVLNPGGRMHGEYLPGNAIADLFDVSCAHVSVKSRGNGGVYDAIKFATNKPPPFTAFQLYGIDRSAHSEVHQDPMLPMLFTSPTYARKMIATWSTDK